MKNGMSVRHRVIVIGDTGVGKSSLINHLLGKEVAEVGSAGSVTSRAQAYAISENLEIVDTRGTDEAGTGIETWEQAFLALLRNRPTMVIWCLEGHARSKLDQHFCKFEALMKRAFDEMRLDPPVLIIANKMDMIEPPGSEYLPAHWPDLRSDKGKNIQKRLKVLTNLHRDLLKNELAALEPTCLEWYRGAVPWNLEAIREQLLNVAKGDRARIIKKLSLPRENFEQILAIQKLAIEKDIANEPDEQQKNIKRQWLNQYISSTNHVPAAINSFNTIPHDPLVRNSFLVQALTFSPYIPLENDPPKFTINAKQFSQTIISLLGDKGASTSECDEILHRLGKASKEILPGFFTLRNAAKVLVAALFGGALLWWLAPAIGGFIGATLFGLKGAAAVSAGLAWLGLGSLAAGGFGMFGGTIVIVGAGSTLAGGVSAAALKVVSDNLAEQSALMECTRVLQTFELIIGLINKGKLEKDLALEFESNFASVTANLRHSSLPTSTEDLRLEQYNKGLAIYEKTLSLLTQKRTKAGIRYYREQ